MNYNILLDMATDLGYELAMAGAETFRVEESISRVLASYGVESEVFAIPNYLIVTILVDGAPITRMRRIGSHGNDLDAVEKLNSLSRRYCRQRPEPHEGMTWLTQALDSVEKYPFWMEYVGDFIGAAGFALLFSGSWQDSLCAGFCGIVVGIVTNLLARQKSNPFFRTIAAAFVMALLAYALSTLGLAPNPDAVTIGALMLLVPGLLFTNAMRDIIYGDTNSGINRVVQVLLTAIAIALGTAVAWSVADTGWGIPSSAAPVAYSIPAYSCFALLGCIGFAILFNIHGRGMLLCALGGMCSWAIYLISLELGANDILSYFWSALFASIYSESMARIRKFPAISYLVVSIFPMIPGAGAYYTMNYAVRGDMTRFASEGLHTAAIAGILAVGILLGTTVFRMAAEIYSKRRMK